MRSIVKTAVFVVIALFREKGFLDDKAPPPGKIFEVLIEKFAEYTICDEFMEKMLDYICLKRLKYLLLLSFPKSIRRYR